MIPLREDESSHVDSAGFLVNDIEDVHQSPTTPPLTIGYDLSPFESDDDNFFVTEQEPQEEENIPLEYIEDGTDSSDDRKKLDIVSLLQKGGSEKQLARIEMYNTRITDSDSESAGEEEDTLSQQSSGSSDEEEDILNESGAYAGLPDGQDDGSICNDIDDIDGLVPLAETIQFNEQVSNDLKPSTVSCDEGASDELHKERSESEKDDKFTWDLSPRPNTFAASVPLLKPPPAEKMRLFLKSKGLIDAVKEESWSS